MPLILQSHTVQTNYSLHTSPDSFFISKPRIENQMPYVLEKVSTCNLTLSKPPKDKKKNKTKNLFSVSFLLSIIYDTRTQLDLTLSGFTLICTLVIKDLYCMKIYNNVMVLRAFQLWKIPTGSLVLSSTIKYICLNSDGLHMF